MSRRRRSKAEFRYLNHFPPPLLQELVAGRWLPLLGAGISRNASTRDGTLIPLWPDLGELLAKDVLDFDTNDPVEAISSYEQEYLRPRLVERISELLLIGEATPGRVHATFCRIPFDIVCTTNIDFLLEDQYTLLGKSCVPLIDETHLSTNLKKGATALLKVHGDVHHPDRLIVTESDYDRFLTDYPLVATYLSNLLITRTPVLIGYSLNDPDFRQIMHVVSARLGRLRRQAWAILVGATPGEVRRYERRGVKVINLPGAKASYGTVLGDALDELSRYFDQNVLEASQITEEDSSAELRFGPDQESRICLFLIPEDSLALYKKHVFPSVEETGFIPLAPEDVISPAGSDVAKREALVTRARAIVVDVTSPSTLRELDFVLVSAPEAQLLIVAMQGEPLPLELPEEAPIVYRSPATLRDPHGFSTRIAQWLQGEGALTSDELINEPNRLLELGEYALAIISAVRVLEATLRERLNPNRSDRRPRSLSALLAEAENQQLLPSGTTSRSREWMGLRNEVVHLGRQVHPQTAKSVVRQILEIVNLLHR